MPSRPRWCFRVLVAWVHPLHPELEEIHPKICCWEAKWALPFCFLTFMCMCLTGLRLIITPQTGSSFTPRLIDNATCNHRWAAMSTQTCVPGILTSVASALPLLLLIHGATLGPQIPMCSPPQLEYFQNGLHSSHLWWTPKQLTSVTQGFTCLHFLFCFRNAGTVQVLLWLYYKVVSGDLNSDYSSPQPNYVFKGGKTKGTKTKANQ